MNNRGLIHTELQSVAPALLNVPVTMPYTLPPDYFNCFPDIMLELAKNQELTYIVLENIGKQMPFSIPNKYFEQFSSIMLKKVHAEGVLALEDQLDLLTGLPKAMPYTVPQGYFEQFAETVLQKRSAEAQPASVPTGYFESFPEQMLYKIRKLEVDNELAEIAPTLKNLDRKPLQHIPANYFDSLVLPTLEKTSEKQQTPAPVISIQRKNNWLKYVAAASVVFLLGLSAYFFFRNDNSNRNNPNIADVNTLKNINIDVQLASLDNATIETYLDQHENPTEKSIEQFIEANTTDMDTLFQSIPSTQIEQHLEQNGLLPVSK